MTAPGAVIGDRFLVLARLGEGGIGTVFRVSDPRRGADLALKLIPRQHLGGVSLRYFRDEFVTLSRLRHPNITEVFDFGLTPDQAHVFYTAELVDGVDFVRATEACRSPAGAAAAERAFARLHDLTAQAARALDHVHAHGYIHFDVKPANMLVRTAAEGPGVVKLLDFGLSSERTTRRRPGLRGTLPYMAPEVIRGDPVDRRADLYSLGATLYEATTGIPPFGGPYADVADVERGHLRDEPVPPRKRNPHVPAPLEKVILRLLRKEPSHRYGTAEEVVRVMRLFGAVAPSRAAPRAEPARPLRPSYCWREEVRPAIDDALYTITQAQGPRVLLVEGEAGIGTTRLLREASHKAQLEGIASALIDPCAEPTPTSLATSIAWALSLRGAPADPGGSARKAEHEPSELAERLAAQIARAARERPLVILLDAVDRVDPDVETFIARLLRSLVVRHGARRALVVLGARQGDVPRSLAAAAEEVRAQRLRLRQLSTREVLSVLRSALGRTPEDEEPDDRRHAELIEAEVGGNPLRVERLIGALADQGAVTVREGRFHLDVSLLERSGARPWSADIFAGALAGLAPDAARIARRLAALEGPADLFLLERVAALPEGAFGEAFGALRRRDVVHIISGHGKRERIGFRHEAVARAARAETRPDEAQAANDIARRVIAARARRLGRDGKRVPLAIVERLAHHALRGSDRKEALRAALEAAERLEGALARARAAAICSAALGLADGDPATRVALLERLGVQEEHLGHPGAARERYTAALAATEALPPGDATDFVRGRLVLRQGTTFAGQSDPRSARPVFHRALSLLPAWATVDRGRIMTRLAWLAVTPPRARPAAAIRLARRARQELEKTPPMPAGTLAPSDDRALAILRSEVALSAFHEVQAAFPEALCWSRTALRSARRLGRPDEIAASLGNIARLMYKGHRPAAAEPITRASLRWARRAGSARYEASGLLSLGMIEWARGRHKRAGKHFDAAAAIFRAVGNVDMSTQSATNAAFALERRGEYAEALAKHEGAIEEARRAGRHQAEAVSRLGAASSAILAGDHAGAAASLAKVDEMLSRGATPALRAEVLEARARLLRDMGREREAVDAADAARRLRADLAPSLDAAAAALERAEMLVPVKGADEALLAWRDASDRAKELRAPFLRALSAYVRGRIAQAEGRPKLAVRALQRSSATFPEREDVDLAWRAARALGLALEAAGEPKLAAAHLDRAARIVREVDDRLPPQLSDSFRRRAGVADLLARSPEASPPPALVTQARRSPQDGTAAPRPHAPDAPVRTARPASLPPPPRDAWDAEPAEAPTPPPSGRPSTGYPGGHGRPLSASARAAGSDSRASGRPASSRPGSAPPPRYEPTRHDSSRDGSRGAGSRSPSTQPPAPLASEGIGELAEAIIKVNRDIAAERDSKRVLSRLLDEAIHLSRAQRGFITLTSKRAPSGLRFRVGRSLDRTDILAKHAYSTTIVRHVIASGRLAVVADCSRDARFREAQSIVALNISSVLCVPLTSRRKTIGALYLDHQFRTEVFGPTEQRAVSALADQAAIAIENGRLLRHAERAHAEAEELANRLEHENRSQSRELTSVRRTLADVQGDPELTRRYRLLVGSSPPMIEMLRLIDKIAPSDLPVLIQGESGTGKELVARAIHMNSPRKLKTFVCENCSAIPEGLLEAELFGSKRGSYTGSHADKEGLLERAHGGTLFLDEIGDMSAVMQAKLLRVLQSGEMRPIGAVRSQQVDVRLISATNKDLEKEIAEGRFREDLYYRLEGVLVETPPLRDRGEDVLLLVDRFLEGIAERMRVPKKTLGAGVIEVLSSFNWPGNVRQLEHEVERAAQLAGDRIELEHLSAQVRKATVEEVSLADLGPRSLDLARLTAERRVLLAALARCGENRTKTAKLLGVSRFGLLKMIQRCKI